MKFIQFIRKVFWICIHVYFQRWLYYTLYFYYSRYCFITWFWYLYAPLVSVSR